DAEQGDQAGGRRAVAVPALGPAPPRGAARELPILRAALRERQLAQPLDTRAGRRAAGRDGAGAALLAAGGRDRSGEQHGQRSGRRARRRAGRVVAGRGVRLRRAALRRARPGAGAAPAARLARAEFSDLLAGAALPREHGWRDAPGGGAVKPESIIVPLDGTPGALAAVPVAAALTTMLDAALHVLHVGERVLPSADRLRELGLTPEMLE